MAKNITGAVFRKMMISGANYLEKNKEYVDSLNVFPVPDGDTGTNMSLTMRSAVKELNMVTSNDIEPLASAVAKGALKGARGNSGVILSQILKGFTTVLAHEKNITTKAFAKALKEGSNVAYGAVTKPKEGTILTVIRLMSEQAIELAKKYTELPEFLQHTLEAGEEVLKQTPELLPVLKKAGVVDAGGRGLLVILTGFYQMLSGNEVDNLIAFESDKVEGNDPFQNANVDYNDLAEIEFAYCTEFWIINIKSKTTEADIDRLRESLMELGDSVICIGDLNGVHVHVHTNEPGVALTKALQLGEVDTIKIENMLEQFRSLKNKQAQPEELKPIGMVAICAGEGLSAIFKDLNVDYVIEGGQTMNPSAEDIAAAADKVLAETVFVLPNNKNIILAAELAKDLSRRNIVVVPTTSVPQGITAAINLNPEDSVDTNLKNMTTSIDTVLTGSVTYAVRSTHIDGFKLKEGDIIGLDNKNIIAKGEDINAVATEVVDKLINENIMTITLFFGAEVQEAEAQKLVDELSIKYPEIEVDCHFGGQPLYYYMISLE